LKECANAILEQLLNDQGECDKFGDRRDFSINESCAINRITRVLLQYKMKNIESLVIVPKKKNEKRE